MKYIKIIKVNFSKIYEKNLNNQRKIKNQKNLLITLKVVHLIVVHVILRAEMNSKIL